jgi:hypothetical protein
MPLRSGLVRGDFMSQPVPGDGVPEDWIGSTVLVLSRTTGETLLPGGGYTFVGEVYSGELRAVNFFGISLSLTRAEGAFYPAGDTFFPWGSVVRISLAD